MVLDDIETHAARLVALASRVGVTVATAESCTAGMVASSIAGVAGASSVLRGGAVTYCDEIKHRVLNVPKDDLERFSAVSEPVARAMVTGTRALYESDFAVSLTGYAGPGGGTEDDPVGTVYLGFATPQRVDVERYVFAGTRNEVRTQACDVALQGLIKRIEMA